MTNKGYIDKVNFHTSLANIRSVLVKEVIRNHHFQMAILNEGDVLGDTAQRSFDNIEAHINKLENAINALNEIINDEFVNYENN